jgi:hypothetical protein
MQIAGTELDTETELLINSSLTALWNSNGNYLSVQYTGTASTSAGCTNGEKEGIINAMNSVITSVERFVVNNFKDGFKQKCIEVLLGQKKGAAEKAEFEEKSIYVFIGSWNVNCVMPDMSLDVTSWINKSDETP